MSLASGRLIADDDLPPHVREKRPVDFLGAAVARRMTVAELERELIERVLEGKAGNKIRAAQRLSLDRKTSTASSTSTPRPAARPPRRRPFRRRGRSATPE